MKNDESRQLARYIMTTGKLIHDRIVTLHHPHFGSGRHKQALKELSLSQIQTIMSVYSCGQISMTALAKQMGVSPPSSSSMVDRLVDKGILIRERSQNDRRRVMVQVAPSFKTDIQTIEEVILLKFVDLVEKLGHETTVEWCDVLEKVKTILEKDQQSDN
jgi:DNA-binding MarR family transcriptional regulator